MHELKCFSDYVSGGRLGYWRSTSGFEVDFTYEQFGFTRLSDDSPRQFQPLESINL